MLHNISGSSTWVGGCKEGNTWLWLNNKTINFGWASGEPNHDYEKCVDFYFAKGYLLNNAPCEEENPFICEGLCSYA